MKTLTPEALQLRERKPKPLFTTHLDPQALTVLRMVVPGRKPRLLDQILGRHLDQSPEPDRQALAQQLANNLLQAQGLPVKPVQHASETFIDYLQTMGPRSLIGPKQLSDADLKLYLKHTAPAALRSSITSTYQDLSPRTAALLLGGLTLYEVEELAERALDLLGFEPDTVTPSLSDALAAVGHNPNMRHDHLDTFLVSQLYQRPNEERVTHLNRIEAMEPPEHSGALNPRKEWLAQRTEGAFADYLNLNCAYAADLKLRIAKLKPMVMFEAYDALRYGSPQIQEHSRNRIRGLYGVEHWKEAEKLTNEQFTQAVRQVYERPWHELRLSGDPALDVVPVMARLLISKLCKPGRLRLQEPVRINARALIGMSLLTGIPTGKFVRFALQDLERRGETFLTPATVREVRELVDVSGVFHLAGEDWMRELEQLEGDLEFTYDPAQAYWAQKLRGLKYPLYSPENFYSTVWVTNEGEDNEKAKYVPRRDLKMNRITGE